MKFCRKPLFNVLIALIGALGLYGCQTAPQKQAQNKILPPETESALSEQLTANIEKQYGKWNDKVVFETLNDMLRKIIEGENDPELKTKLAGTEVRPLVTETPLIAPGIYKVIYVSKGMVKFTSYENELSFALSLAVSLLKSRETANRLTELRGQEISQTVVSLPTAPVTKKPDPLEKNWFAIGGLFDFGKSNYLKAVREGVRLSYSANFDPRGALTFISRFEEDTRTEVLRKLFPASSDQKVVVKEEISKLSPRKDPIVRSESYKVLQSKASTKARTGK
ncbi:MAG: hypothetical protein AB7F43_03245 [Bacteriovoracia bacterium]